MSSGVRKLKTSKHLYFRTVEQLDAFVRQDPAENFLRVWPRLSTDINNYVKENSNDLFSPHFEAFWASMLSLLKHKAARAQTLRKEVTPPIAPTERTTLTIHGDVLYDDYSWMKNREDTRLLEYIKAENEYTTTFMAHTTELQTQLYEEFVERIQDNEVSLPLKIGDYYYYNRRSSDNEYKVMCRKYVSMDSEEEILLDCNEEAKKESYYSLCVFEVNPQANLLAYSIDTTGREYYTLQFRYLPPSSTALGTEPAQPPIECSETIMNTLHAVWHPDGRTIYYTTVDETQRSFRLFRHTVGTNPSEDVCVYHEPDERYHLRISRTNDRNFLLLQSSSNVASEVRYMPVRRRRRRNSTGGDFAASIATASSEADEHSVQIAVEEWNYDGFVEFYPAGGRNSGGNESNSETKVYLEHNSGDFYVLFRDTLHPNFMVLKVPSAYAGDAGLRLGDESIAEPAGAVSVIVPHRSFVKIEAFEVFHNHLVVYENANCTPKIRIHNLTTNAFHYIEFYEPVYTIWAGDRDDWDDERPVMRVFRTNKLRFTYSSLTQPAVVYEYDMDTKVKVRLRSEGAGPNFDSTLYESERLWVQSADGTHVPLSLVYRKEMVREEGNALVMYGYGAYGGSYAPTFVAERLSLLDRGVVVAIAHVRGGGELGHDWYREGKLLHKRRSFEDFIACAEYLINEGYTTPERLCIVGRSAGGLLVTASCMMAPHLFRTVIAHVPFVDVVNTMLDASIPWTAFEFDEWGNPQEEKFYHYMKSYCPYQNIREHVSYPNMLFTTGTTDPRVDASEPIKIVAKLRSVGAGAVGTGRVVLLKVYEGGHLGKSGRFQWLEDIAFEYAFILDSLGVEKPRISFLTPLASITPALATSTTHHPKVSTKAITSLPGNRQKPHHKSRPSSSKE